MCSWGELSGQANSYRALEVQPGLNSSWSVSAALGTVTFWPDYPEDDTRESRHSPVCLVCVITQTFAGVEHEAAGTGLRVRCAIRAVNELVTDGVVWVGEVAISSGTSRAGLGGLKVLPP